MSKPIFQALIMLPPRGHTRAERWVAEGRGAAARDLARRLGRIPSVDQVWVLAADEFDRAAMEGAGARPFRGSGEPFHFGRELANAAEAFDPAPVAYFGGGSAPLMTEDMLAEAFERVSSAQEPMALVNNLHSTDWAIISHPHILHAYSHRFPQDNPLGWVLWKEASLRVEALQPSAASRLDIDTPSDLILANGHPGLGLELDAFLQGIERPWLKRVDRIRAIMASPGASLAIIGRASSNIWRELERRTEIWTRIFVEERGMVASGRLARGEVRSFVGRMVDDMGPEAFLAFFSELADGLIWDTRVWMASQGVYPSPSDRFAADLGWVDEIEDPLLRRLAAAVEKAPMPAIVGGYGVVAGGLYALLETMDGDAAYHPSRNSRHS